MLHTHTDKKKQLLSHKPQNIRHFFMYLGCFWDFTYNSSCCWMTCHHQFTFWKYTTWTSSPKKSTRIFYYMHVSTSHIHHKLKLFQKKPNNSNNNKKQTKQPQTKTEKNIKKTNQPTNTNPTQTPKVILMQEKVKYSHTTFISSYQLQFLEHPLLTHYPVIHQ